MSEQREKVPHQWDPIPDHAIKIDGFPHQWVLPERLVEIEGRQYVRCEDHGLIPADHNCADSRGDHLCLVSAHPNHVPGEDHDDQATAHGEWADNLLARVQAIWALHAKEENGGCQECGLGWPCPTYHHARGFGEMHDCFEAGWCDHLNERVDPAEAGYDPDHFGPDEAGPSDRTERADG